VNDASSLKRYYLVFEKSIHGVTFYHIKVWQLRLVFSQSDLPLVPGPNFRMGIGPARHSLIGSPVTMKSNWRPPWSSSPRFDGDHV
jgi:hypothetical protein